MRRGGTWNLQVNRKPALVAREVRELMLDEALSFLCLQECGQYVEALEQLEGCRLIVKGSWPDAHDQAILVRAGVPVSRVRNRAIGDGWFGARIGRRRPGRSSIRATIDGLRVWSIHLPPAVALDRHGHAAPADRGRDYVALMRVVRRYLARRGPRLVAGDWNQSAGLERPLSPRAVATQLGAQVYAPGRRGYSGIDYVLARGCRLAGIRTVMRGTSDHWPVVFRVL